LTYTNNIFADLVADGDTFANTGTVAGATSGTLTTFEVTDFGGACAADAAAAACDLKEEASTSMYNYLSADNLHLATSTVDLDMTGLFSLPANVRTFRGRGELGAAPVNDLFVSL